jgi:hypothetical protein
MTHKKISSTKIEKYYYEEWDNVVLNFFFDHTKADKQDP